MVRCDFACKGEIIALATGILKLSECEEGMAGTIPTTNCRVWEPTWTSEADANFIKRIIEKEYEEAFLPIPEIELVAFDIYGNAIGVK